MSGVSTNRRSGSAMSTTHVIADMGNSIWEDWNGYCWSSTQNRAGHNYILVVSEYATCSFSLTRIDAPRITNKLIDLYARVGIPREILTDRGSNFTSELLNEIYRLLHVHPIRTTPYHSQTNGACGTIILTRPLSRYYVKWHLRQARIRIDYFRIYCLPTVKSLKHPLDSFLLRKRSQGPTGSLEREMGNW